MATFRSTDFQSGDNDNTVLAKILQRLNLNAGIQADAPASNVAITNTPLPVTFSTTPIVTVSGQVHVLVDDQPIEVNITNYPLTQDVEVTNFPVGFNAVVTNTPDVHVTNTPTVTVSGATFQDGHLSTVSVPLDFEIAHGGTYLEDGVAKTAFVYRALGHRAGFNSSSVLQDVAEWLGTSIDLLPEMTGLENLELVSSSIQDDATPGGTGTRVVRITYLTTSYVLTTVDYSLNGTVAVPVAEKMLFVYNMEAISGGASEVSVGNIDLRVAGGGAIHERITAGGNRSLSCRFMVPDNYKAYLFNWNLYAINADMDARLRATVTSLQRALVPRYIFQDTAYLAGDTNMDTHLAFRQCPARSKIKVSVLPSATGATNRVDAGFSILLVQD